MKPQTINILNHLRIFGPITPLEALRDYGCSRLAARIQELRDLGWNVITEYETKGKKRWAKYHLGRAA